MSFYDKFEKFEDWYFDTLPKIILDAICFVVWWITIAPVFAVGWVAGKLYSGLLGGWCLAR